MTPLPDARIEVHVALTGTEARLVLPEITPCLGPAYALTMAMKREDAWP